MINVSFESRLFSDVDEKSLCMAGYDLEYRQLSRGSYLGRHTVARLGADLALNFEQNNRVLSQFGVTPVDQYTLYFLMNDNVHTKLNGRTFSENHLFLCGPQTTWDTVDLSDAGQSDERFVDTHYVALSFKEDFFESQILGCHSNSPIASALRQESVFREDPRQLLVLKRKIRYIMNCLRRRGDGGKHFGIGVRASIVEILSDYLRNVSPSPTPGYEMQCSKPYRTVKHVRDVFHEKYDAEVSINTLCCKLGISRRMLEYHFQDQVGVSPMAYLRSIRLNESRRKLLSPDHVNLSVGDIAAEFGFWHPSRFASYYREQFGENPSETRARIGLSN